MVLHRIFRVAAVLFFCGAVSVHAATVTYNFNAGTLDPIASGAAATSITPGSSTGLLVSGSQLSVSGWGNTGSIPSAVAAGDFFTFDLSAVTGHSLTLTGISVWAATTATTGNQRFQVDYSLNGGASYDSGAPLISANVGSGTTYTSTPLSLSVSDLSFVRFRFSGYDNKSGRFLFDNISIQGDSSAVPAPGAAVLLLAGLGLEALRRRKKKGAGSA